MRTIKFRAWSNFEELMSYDVTLYANGWYRVVFPNGYEAKYTPNSGLKVMQYTGLKDKNGTEIYEGDIVKVIHEDGYKTIGQVEWGLSSKWFGTYPAFAIRELESEMNSFAEVFDTGQYTIEVIGNIYEHPELLKE